MPKQQEIKPGPTQLKGEDGQLETVVVGGVRVNKHEHDEESDGKAQPDEHSAYSGKQSGASGAKKSKKSKSDEDFDSMTVEELKSYLDKEGIEYASDDLKDDLIKHARKGK